MSASDSDPILTALAAVEDDPEATDPGKGMPEHGEEADARPEGPAPDAGDELEDADDSGGFDVLSWAERIPEGSHLNFEKKDWWDPETGAETRIAFHLSDAAGAGAGYPNGIGLLVGVAELYYSRVFASGGADRDGDDAQEDETPTGDTVARSEAEALV